MRYRVSMVNPSHEYAYNEDSVHRWFVEKLVIRKRKFFSGLVREWRYLGYVKAGSLAEAVDVAKKLVSETVPVEFEQ